ncbi:MAG: hypothetical protein ON057_000150 [Glomeribacter sp. 1016415]|uniref:Uncharacterized protein n=1 Tax=Mycoavidus cysteinexigens TaxID=1553431 RepID=A0A2Z6EU00_9BURK|nr:hypothetical protein [Mycoavidus cysteinexigens]MCX8565423.1 hypothetical protein [Glomeribacter sp. 1016415]BBE08919.1 Uncharacterized protein MCB1EB_0758 [Mycoavidus cysteinexigens]GAM52358.1 hypothetical protein EBME_0821 [bacterium endosymbiont of Mortierella elongata FMR23-6]GLR01237.1 hypothetical protein GCM10007934_10490 [Mycoavidus cysteinexigens]
MGTLAAVMGGANVGSMLGKAGQTSSKMSSMHNAQMGLAGQSMQQNFESSCMQTLAGVVQSGSEAMKACSR